MMGRGGGGMAEAGGGGVGRAIRGGRGGGHSGRHHLVHRLKSVNEARPKRRGLFAYGVSCLTLAHSSRCAGGLGLTDLLAWKVHFERPAGSDRALQTQFY